MRIIVNSSITNKQIRISKVTKEACDITKNNRLIKLFIIINNLLRYLIYTNRGNEQTNYKH